jgi:hypothetical protein
MVIDIWFAIGCLYFLKVVIGSNVFGQAVSSFFLPFGRPCFSLFFSLFF